MIHQQHVFAMQAPVVQQQQQIVTVQSPVIQQQQQQQVHTNNNTNRPRYSQKTATALAISQIVLGVLALVFGIVAIEIGCTKSHIGSGIWCGLFFLLTGCIGCVSASRKTQSSWIIASMTLSIIAASICGCVFVLISLIAVIQEESDVRYTKDCFSGIICSTVYSRPNYTKQAINGVLLVIAIIETIVGAVNAVYSGRVICCTHKEPRPSVYYVAPQATSHNYQTSLQVGTTHVQPGVYMVQPGVQVHTHTPVNHQIRIQQPVASSSVIYTT